MQTLTLTLTLTRCDPVQLEPLELRCAALQKRHGRRREKLAGRAARIRTQQRAEGAAAKGRAAGGANASLTPSRQHDGGGAMGPPTGTPAKGTPVRCVSEVDVGGEGADDELGVNAEPLILWAEQKGRGKLAAVVGAVSVSPGLASRLKEHQRDAVRYHPNPNPTPTPNPQPQPYPYPYP